MIDMARPPEKFLGSDDGLRSQRALDDINIIMDFVAELTSG
jgi:hypothetical protein